MTDNIRIHVQDSSQVGEARRAAMQLCARIGGDDEWQSRVGIVVTELARNLELHGEGGEILLRELTGFGEHGLEAISTDKGRGMPNLADCLRDGFSTAGTSGTGLGAIQRLSDFFDIYTARGGGSIVCCRFYKNREKPSAETLAKFPRVGGISVPLLGENVCGDGWAVLQQESLIRLLVVDGLGHGRYAAEAAWEATAVFQKHHDQDIVGLMETLHHALMKTRGAAAAMVQINAATSQLDAVGVGNCVIRIFDADGGSRQLPSVNGTLGSSFRKARSLSIPWTPECTLVMHSDGISTQWDLANYPGLQHRHPSLIAGVLFRDYARPRDDATVIALNSFP